MVLDLAKKGSLSVSCVTNGPVQTNTYFVCSQGEVVVIDPAWDGEALARELERMCPGVRPVGIVCTHNHADHTGGVAGMRRALGDGVPFLISRVDAPGVHAAIEQMKDMWGLAHEEPPAPDRLLDEGDAVCVGDAVLQVFSVPGHTPGGIVLFAAAAQGDVAFVGDTLFQGSHGRTDLPGGDDAQILRSLAKMARLLPADTLCLTGHGDVTTMERECAQNPFVVYALGSERPA